MAQEFLKVEATTGEGATGAPLDKGRVAFHEYEWVIKYDDFYADFIGYPERNCEHFIRTLLWAAAKEPGIELQPPATFYGADARRQIVGITGRNAADAVGRTLRLDIRRDLDRQYPFLYAELPNPGSS